MLKASRMDARPSNAVDVKGTGPFGFWGQDLIPGLVAIEKSMHEGHF